MYRGLAMVEEPPTMRSTKRVANAQSNPYNGRWRWWYSAIADYMIANPGCTGAEIAKHLGKAVNTIHYIQSSDTFREYYALRRRAFVEEHDFALTTKLRRVTERSLDNLASVLEKRGDQIPAQVLSEMATSGLDRLGFAPKRGPEVAVNVTQDLRRVVTVNASALEEARQAMRLAEERRRGISTTEQPVLSQPDVEVEDDPIPGLD